MTFNLAFIGMRVKVSSHRQLACIYELLKECDMGRFGVRVVDGGQPKRQRLLHRKIEEVCNLLFAPGGMGIKLIALSTNTPDRTQSRLFLVRISYAHVPVGLPAASRTMRPPSTCSGRLGMSSSTAGDTQRAWPSTRLSEISLPLRSGSAPRSAWTKSIAATHSHVTE